MDRRSFLLGLAALLGGGWPAPAGAAFLPGEALDFDLNWQGISVAKATMRVAGDKDLDGRPGLHLTLNVNTAANFFYTVRTTMQSYAEPDLTVFGKCITGGYPMAGGVGGRADVIMRFAAGIGLGGAMHSIVRSPSWR